MKIDRFLRVGYSLFTIGGILFLISGCNRQQASAPMQKPPVVTIAPAQQQEVVEWEEFTGRTEAVEAVEVRPRVNGHIDEVLFQAGQLVKKGDVLFQIDPRWYQAEVDRRQAEYEQAKVRLDNSERDAKRAASLLADHALSIEEADNAEAQYQEAKAALLATKAQLESAQLDLDYTKVRAPITGKVSRALLTAGNYVSGDAGSATLLTTLVSVDPIYVYADVDETSLLKFNKLASELSAQSNDSNGKIPVQLALTDENGYPHQGYVESFDNHVNANSGTIVMRVVFPNPDGRIVPGLFARVRVPATKQYAAIVVDETAVGTDQGQKFVLTLNDKNVVQYQQVQLGPVIDGKRIIRSGLQPGEKIVVNGLYRARPGLPVTPQEQVASTPVAAGTKTAQQ
ncbi:MAG: efflux RND transporter periplasmic adaptor subunit [Verrucomicrobiales bacterium]|jgi:RND family efflux transporter MFP subunit|nr:efflux RND transporter periplasmic adaptor subunit [Verrucomicrobiales bacterium]